MIGSVLVILHFCFQIINLLEIRSEILDHVICLAALCTRIADKNNRFIVGQRLYALLQLISRDIDRCLEGSGLILIRVTDINQENALRIFLQDLVECGNLDTSFVFACLYLDSFGCTGILFPSRVSCRKYLHIPVADLDRLPGGLVTQPSGIATTVEDKCCVHVQRKFAF